MLKNDWCKRPILSPTKSICTGKQAVSVHAETIFILNLFLLYKSNIYVLPWYSMTFLRSSVKLADHNVVNTLACGIPLDPMYTSP